MDIAVSSTTNYSVYNFTLDNTYGVDTISGVSTGNYSNIIIIQNIGKIIVSNLTSPLLMGYIIDDFTNNYPNTENQWYIKFGTDETKAFPYTVLNGGFIEINLNPAGAPNASTYIDNIVNYFEQLPNNTLNCEIFKPNEKLLTKYNTSSLVTASPDSWVIDSSTRPTEINGISDELESSHLPTDNLYFANSMNAFTLVFKFKVKSNSKSSMSFFVGGVDISGTNIVSFDGGTISIVRPYELLAPYSNALSTDTVYAVYCVYQNNNLSVDLYNGGNIASTTKDLDPITGTRIGFLNNENVIISDIHLISADKYITIYNDQNESVENLTAYNSSTIENEFWNIYNRKLYCSTSLNNINDYNLITEYAHPTFNISFTLHLFANNSSSACLMFDVTSETAFKYIEFSDDKPAVISGQSVPRANTTYLTPGRNYNVNVSNSENYPTLVVKLDGIQKYSGSEPTSSTGKLGFLANSNFVLSNIIYN